jgi:hypothetical protein
MTTPELGRVRAKTVMNMGNYGKMNGAEQALAMPVPPLTNLLSIAERWLMSHSIPFSISDEELARFWSRVDRSGGPNACWEWMGPRSEFGHGRFYISNRHVPSTCGAHRFSWTVLNGPIPDGLCVLHDCPGGDNPACVNPAHLWLGTQADNNRDTYKKGQKLTGEQHPWHINPYRGERAAWSKLNDALIRRIRKLLADGVSHRTIAKELHIGKSTVTDVNTGKSWSHVS